tara:strand:+ start:140244 stop:142034 length:1791 start_codon:yes stop_codon:yes gene_type:complete
VDPPFVAGIILSKPLPLGGSHIEIMSNKLGIPLVYIEGSYSQSAMKKLEASGNYALLDSSGQSIRISNVGVDFSSKPVTEKSAMPEKADRTRRGIVGVAGAEKLNINQIGEKFLGLAYAKKILPKHAVPRISTLLSGEWEAFKATKIEGSRETLGEFIERTYGEIESESNQAIIREKLESVRHAIVHQTKNDQFFRHLYSQVYVHYGAKLRPDSRLSIRSNNDVEDLLAAGLYESVVTKSFSPESLESAIREVWASMYSYRAFQIRRYRNLHEDRLSMPVLIHPFIGNEAYNGVASASVVDGKINIEIKLVEGSEVRATSPDQSVKVQTLYVTAPFRGNSAVVVSQMPNGPHVNLDPKITNIVDQLLSHVYTLMNASLNKRFTLPEEIDLEWTADNSHSVWSLKLLQYKEVINPMLIADVLSGEISRGELYPSLKSSFGSGKSSDFKAFSETANLLEFENYVVGPNSPREWTYYHKTRYVLALINGTPKILLWETNKLHHRLKEDIENLFDTTEFQWILSGYLNFTKTRGFGVVQPTLNLEFSIGGIPSTNPDVPKAYVQDVMIEALQNLKQVNPKYKVNVTYETRSRDKYQLEDI